MIHSTIKKTFKVSELLDNEIDSISEVGDGINGWEVISKEIVGLRRWTALFQLVFHEPGQGENLAWGIIYSVPLTEEQCGSENNPFMDEEGTVEAHLMQAQLVTAWKMVK